MIRTIHLDMDGVIADFDGYIKKVSGKTPDELNRGVNVTPHTNNERDDPVYAIMKEHIMQHDMFYEIDPLENLDEWKRLIYETKNRGYKVELLSASPNKVLHDHAKDQKVRWVKKHGINVDGVIVVPFAKMKKQYAMSSSILIDDYEKNVIGYIRSGGLAILHKNLNETKSRLGFYIGNIK